jgi:peptidoglycan/xylan/chitin deacetylase (PgdA/CDA1 family)
VADADTRAIGAPLVLCYHAISEQWPAVLATSPDRLEAQLRRLLERGGIGTTFREAMAGDATPHHIAVTFDDACRSVSSLAFPILRDLGLQGTVYVPTDFVGSDEPMAWPGISRWKGTRFEDELLCLDWGRLEKLADAGWEIGSHTRSHPKLSEVSDDELAEQLVSSRELLAERVGGGQTIAYPYGDQDARVRAAAQGAGYEAAAGLRPGPRSRWCWPRVGIYPADKRGRFALKTARVVRRARASHLAGLLDSVRQAHS